MVFLSLYSFVCLSFVFLHFIFFWHEKIYVLTCLITHWKSFLSFFPIFRRRLWWKGDLWSGRRQSGLWARHHPGRTSTALSRVQ